MQRSYTLLVNSCDAFEDCWAPFFVLFKKYWPQPWPPILLNTETKTWRFEGLDIESARVSLKKTRVLSWSECLSEALERVDTPLVLYMQEDYFIEQQVDTAWIDSIAEIMLECDRISHVGLTLFGAGNPIYDTEEQGLSRVGRLASYRVSTQAGLWRVPTLRSYLLPWESGWMFELLGTTRSWKRSELFLTISRSANIRPPIVYQHTGIIKGKWSSFVDPLFKREGIEVDLGKRGIFDNSQSALKRRLNLIRQIMKDPWALIRSIGSR
jgi:hypothetical protein